MTNYVCMYVIAYSLCVKTHCIRFSSDLKAGLACYDNISTFKDDLLFERDKEINSDIQVKVFEH